ncbi:MAG: acyl-CoA dehydrogenase family protein [Deltaproteobacteria bacterium]|nr:acyl-CoA dehydrogenase family protein [Deltaproteobacteria bacterium]
MELDLNQEQKIVSKSARDFLRKECPKSLVRAMRDDEQGYSQELWDKMAAMGWMGVEIPEAYGGTGGDFLDLCLLLEAMGEACLPGPFFATVVLGLSAILRLGTDEQKKALLPQVADGKRLMTLAVTEPGNWYGASKISTTAERNNGTYRLNGVKLFVDNAQAADPIICAARAGDGLSLFIVDAEKPGLKIKTLKTLGYEKQCEVVLDNVAVPEAGLLGPVGGAGPFLEAVENRAAVAKCAEMLGVIGQAFELSLAYAKEREQFGRPIGAFQAIQHHLANMAVAMDSARYLTYQAAWKLAQELPAEKEASMAKAYVSQASGLVTRLAHQIHGAISFCDEHDLHLYTRKAKAAAASFGDADYHLEKVARNLGL